MTKRRALLVLVAVIVAARLALACSSGDDSAPTAGDGGGVDATLSAAGDGATPAADGSDDAQPVDAGAGDAIADAAVDAANVLVVYSDVPGLAPSTHYSFRVRAAGDAGIDASADAGWQTSFAFVTSSAADGDAGYWTNLASWSNTYTNVETNDPVEVEIARVDGTPITTAVAHPAAKVSSTTVTNGKAYIDLPGPAQVAVDIDGQMDTQDTGYKYAGPPIHTVTLFANPVLATRPDANDPTVHVVQPGETPPDTGAFTTLAFASGVHDIGLAFPVHAGKSYYIPGDAIVYGTLVQESAADGHDITVYGYGTLSGAHLTQPKFVTPTPADMNLYQSISIEGAQGTQVTGLSFADPAFHTLQLYGAYTEGAPSTVSWVKIMGWRVNGDGVNPFGNVLLTDSFIRTQDDGSYANGRGIQRVVYWNDANGSDFVLSALPEASAALPLIIEDCDVIYARAASFDWSGGRLFNMRAMGSGASGSNVTFRDIRLEDTRPTLQAFMIAMEGVAPWSDAGTVRGPGALGGVLFQNITVAKPSVLGQPDVLWGAPDAGITGITFDNLTIDGTRIDSLDHFQTNAYVSDVTFE